MATLALTFTAANGNQGALIRKLAQRLGEAATNMPDHVPGSNVVLTVDNAPSGGQASIQVTSGNYLSSLFIV